MSSRTSPEHGGPTSSDDDGAAESPHAQGARVAEGATLDLLGVGHAQLDADWTIRYVNSTAEQITAAAPGALVGRDHWTAFPAMAGTDFEHNYRLAVATGEPVVFRAFYPDPLRVWVEIRAVPRNGVLDVYFSDITAQVRAEDDARASTARLALVADINADLIATADVPATVADLGPRLVPLLADGVMITLVDRSGLRRDTSFAHREPRRHAALAEYVRVRPNAIPPASPLGRVLATGDPLRSSAAYVASTVVSGPVRDSLLELGDSWSLHLPIRDRTDVLGVLTLFFAADREPDAEDELTLTEIASRIAMAMRNALSVRTHTQLAEDLQRSLLTSPPEVDLGQIEARYIPAAEVARVGGDWYDAFVGPDGATTLVIGDVAGHDTAAAATMGQLRGLLRGIATYSEAGPAEVLRGLDRAMDVLSVDGLATAAVVQLRPDDVRPPGSTRMTWANAGHPPPMVLHANGRVEVAGGPRGDLLLGVDAATTRTEHTMLLESGATVLLFTDGLVEQRDADLDAGTDRLIALIEDLDDGRGSLDEFCDGLVQGMLEGRPDDDVALIAIRLGPGRAPIL